jgi:(p)ppGpp synthase/HD superfamily hydrolase
MGHGIIHSKSQGLIDFAYEYAKEAHGDQKRKYTGEPYINHPVAVARIVATVTEGCSEIAAALLHDVIEDTDRTYEDIRDAGFGFPVADLVREVSDVSKPEDGNRAARKEIDRRHLSEASKSGQTIKLADLIHNTTSICKYDPEFAAVYMKEKKLLLEVLTKGNAALYDRAQRLVDGYYGLMS